MVKKVWNVVWSIIEFVIIVYVICMTSILLSKNKFGYTQFGKTTMVNIDMLGEKKIDGVKEGDLLLVKNTNDIKVGDLIYYIAVYDEAYIVRTDKVTDITTDDISSIYTIDRDGLTTLSRSRVLGRDAKVYHKIGGILNVIESRIGFLFLVLLPILIIFIYQVYEFIVIIKYETNDTSVSTKKEESTEIL